MYMRVILLAYDVFKAWVPNDSFKKWWSWSISEHLSIRKMRLCQIHTWVVSVNLVFFNYANVVTWLHTAKKNNKKSLNKICCKLLDWTTLGQWVMQASTKLCLAFYEFFTVIENKRLLYFDGQFPDWNGCFRSTVIFFHFPQRNTFLRRIVKTKPLQRCLTVWEITDRR